MIINNKQIQAIWYNVDNDSVNVIDQLKLPFKYEEFELKSLDDAFRAIKEMVVRGAPLIGITAAYGLYLWTKHNNSNISELIKAGNYLKSSRPTAVNLEFEVNEIIEKLKKIDPTKWVKTSLDLARGVEQKEIQACSDIGDYGLSLIEEIWQSKQKPVNILTHCNAGWLACGDWGTATSPIYKAHLKGIPVHVWVDETRPRNQGAKLTAWELSQAEVPFTVIPDNTGGHLMQHKMVDLVLVGSDRTTRNGDVANKIGTYLKALAANDNNIPFYVALPSSSIDFSLKDGIDNIPIEKRGREEVSEMDCLYEDKLITGKIIPDSFNVVNYGFDVTPARLVTKIITERGICEANEQSIMNLFPE